MKLVIYSNESADNSETDLAELQAVADAVLTRFNLDYEFVNDADEAPLADWEEELLNPKPRVRRYIFEGEPLKETTDWEVEREDDFIEEWATKNEKSLTVIQARDLGLPHGDIDQSPILVYRYVPARILGITYNQSKEDSDD